jgi:hypothetical protein
MRDVIVTPHLLPATQMVIAAPGTPATSSRVSVVDANGLTADIERPPKLVESVFVLSPGQIRSAGFTKCSWRRELSGTIIALAPAEEESRSFWSRLEVLIG